MANSKENFVGVWATFQYLDDFCDAITSVKKLGFNNLTTHAPCPRHEITYALHEPDSRVPFFTLFFGLLGTITAFTLATWITLDWVLPVSNKPLISIPPFTVIMFELTILFGSYGTALGILFLAKRDTSKRNFPKSDEYKNYNRFMYDRFGLVVRCDSNNVDKVETLLKNNHAEEVYKEN